MIHVAHVTGNSNHSRLHPETARALIIQARTDEHVAASLSPPRFRMTLSGTAQSSL